MTETNEIRITRSYSRKVDSALYGGNRYEVVDFFASYSDTLPKDAPDGDQLKLSQELHRKALADVEKSVTEFIEGLAEKTKVALIEADKKRISQLPESKAGEGGLPF